MPPNLISPSTIRLWLVVKRKIGDKLWSVDQPLLPYISDQNYSSFYGKNAKQKNLAMSLVTKSLSTEDLMVLHLRFAHVTLPRLKLLFPESLHKVEQLPICDDCLSMGYKSRYKKKSDYTKEWSGESVFFGAEATASLFNDDNTAVNFVSTEPASQFCEQANMFSHEDTPKGYGRMFMTDTKSTSKVSVRGYLYLYIILDRDTRVCEVFLGRDKNDLELHLKNFLRRFYNRYKRFPAYWKFDQGGENYSHAIINFLKSSGIQPLYTTTNAHNENSHVERKICVIWDSMLKTLAYTHVPFVYWCYCAVYMSFVWNHIPHRALNGKLPIQMAKMKSFKHDIRVWGCGLWYSLPNCNEHQTRKRFGMNLGWSSLKMGWVILDIETRNVVESRDVIWIETYLPFKQINSVSKIILTCDNWPASKPEEKVSMSLENLLINSNVVDADSQLRGESLDVTVLNPISNSAAPECPPTIPVAVFQPVPNVYPVTSPASNIVAIPISPILQNESTGIDNSMSPIIDENKLQPNVLPSSNFLPTDKNSPTFINNSDGMSPTFVLPQNKYKVKVNDKVTIKDLSKNLDDVKDNLFQDTATLLVDTFRADSMASFQMDSNGFTPANSHYHPHPLNPDDPLSVSNGPEQEDAISRRRFENFRVNGKKAEGLNTPKPPKPIYPKSKPI